MAAPSGSVREAGTTGASGMIKGEHTREILRLMRTGMRQCEVTVAMGISRGTVRRVFEGVRRGHYQERQDGTLDEPARQVKPRRTENPHKARVQDLLRRGYSNGEIARAVGVTVGVVSGISMRMRDAGELLDRSYRQPIKAAHERKQRERLEKPIKRPPARPVQRPAMDSEKLANGVALAIEQSERREIADVVRRAAALGPSRLCSWRPFTGRGHTCCSNVAAAGAMWCDVHQAEVDALRAAS